LDAGEGTGAGEPLITEAAVIRPCHGLPEMRACVALQKEVWNFTDVELVPLRIFVVAEKIGGQVIGAFETDELVGFAFALPGFRAGHAYLHSHMLAVRAGYRNAGLGRRLKLAQRDEALSRGFELMEWTFDPLEIKNSYLNIEKLGAIARRYNVNQYGITSSPLQGGLPTDRLVAEWWLKSDRVVDRLEKGSRPSASSSESIAVPHQIYQWKASAETRERAQQVQSEIRQQFLQAFEKDLSVIGYERDAQQNGKFLLGHGSESYAYK
jgi:predicted GNAT superfamily acetyltransferase